MTERSLGGQRRRTGLLALVRFVLGLGLLSSVAPLQAQEGPPFDLVDGYVSVMVDVLPDVSLDAGRQHAAELRTRLFLERSLEIGRSVRLQLAGYVEGLLADRRALGGSGGSTAAVVRPTDLYVEWRARHFEVRAGASRVVWGRLDEFQPGDVVNPLDTTRFLLEGRSEARLAVPMVRTRAFLPAGLVLEGVVVPGFWAGRSDLLDEGTSPFHLSALEGGVCPVGPEPCALLLPVRIEPKFGWRQLQGGGRVTGTAGRVDLGASAYRGFEPFPILTLGPALPTFAPGPPVHNLFETFPRFTMLAGDFETVTGAWGVRGEAAYFLEDTVQAEVPLAGLPGRSFDIGVGVDRRAGAVRVSGNIVVSRRWLDDSVYRSEGVQPALDVASTDALLVGWLERTFVRETRSVQVLAAWNPEAASAFVRGVGSLNLQDNVWLELSGGWLRGDGSDTLSRLSMRDFAYARLKVYF